MKYERTVSPTDYPVSISEARRHLVVDHMQDNQLISKYIAQASELAESRTGLHIGVQEWTLYADTWCDARSLPFKPVISATISYTDTNGDSQVLDPALYTLDNKAYPAIIDFTGSTLPEIGAGPNVVEVVAVTGYTDAPKAVEAAIYLIVGHLYEHREDVTHTALHEIPNGADMFLNSVRINFL